ncbi:MAG: 4-phosphoerythronate dehydrogenase [Fidelibacterota bacterium]|nr:MAG: 4-phosphoerythronate dehydrogenase [Candidatus Neomarinimicrobiota bacterium]
MRILVDRNIPYASECFSSIGTVEAYSAEDLSSADLQDAEAVVVRAVTPVNADLLDGTAVRFVATSTSGTDHIDLDYLKARGIGFASAAGGNANAVAEYVMAALLHLTAKHDLELVGKSIGIIGVGHIGSKVARKAEALGMRVFHNDPPLQRETGDPRYLPLEQLFNCDFITLHTPLTMNGIDKTYHLMDGNFLDAIRPGVFLINSARGAVADTGSLKRSLAEGHLAGAVLDVWEEEPKIDPDLMNQVDIATPHIAGYSLEGRVSGVLIVYHALCRYFQKEARCSADDLLPEDKNLVIEIDPSTMEGQELINRVVRRAYSIESDDAALRKMVSLPVEERGAYFIRLRRQYRVRREFGQVEIRLQPFAPGVADRLGRLGFRIVHDG